MTMHYNHRYDDQNDKNGLSENMLIKIAMVIMVSNMIMIKTKMMMGEWAKNGQSENMMIMISNMILIITK